MSGVRTAVQKDTVTLQDIFTLSEGQASMQWPSGMSRDDFKDFTDWLIIQQRKIGSTVEGDEKPGIRLSDAVPN